MVDPDKAKAFAKEHSINLDSEEKKLELMRNEALLKLVCDDVNRLANENKFNSLEKPKQLMLLKDPFTIESDILTPTMKLKRNVAKKMYQAEIDRMYAAGPMK